MYSLMIVCYGTWNKTDELTGRYASRRPPAWSIIIIYTSIRTLHSVHSVSSTYTRWSSHFPLYEVLGLLYIIVFGAMLWLWNGSWLTVIFIRTSLFSVDSFYCFGSCCRLPFWVFFGQLQNCAFDRLTQRLKQKWPCVDFVGICVHWRKQSI